MVGTLASRACQLGWCRIAAMSRFWIDKREVSVGRFRAAVARGFTFTEGDVYVQDKVPPVGGTKNVPFERYCTWSSTPIGREDHPINCIDRATARAFCIFEGGDPKSQ